MMHGSTKTRSKSTRTHKTAGYFGLRSLMESEESLGRRQMTHLLTLPQPGSDAMHRAQQQGRSRNKQKRDNEAQKGGKITAHDVITHDVTTHDAITHDVITRGKTKFIDFRELPSTIVPA